MKRCHLIFTCVIVAACNNNSSSEERLDSSGRASSLPPETNYVMENNVNEPVKKAIASDNIMIDTTIGVTVPTVDTAMPYLGDSVSVKK